MVGIDLKVSYYLTLSFGEYPAVWGTFWQHLSSVKACAFYPEEPGFLHSYWFYLYPLLCYLFYFSYACFGVLIMLCLFCHQAERFSTEAAERV